VIASVLVLGFAGAGVLGLLLSRWAAAARMLATGAAGFLAIVAAGSMVRAQRPETFGWVVPGFDLGAFAVPLDLGTSRPTAAVAFVVALVACGVQVYSTWYLRDDDRYPVFAATVSLFTAAMLLVVHSRDLVLTLIGWEVMGWCSYLLIGHWSRRASARRAAYKAFLVTRIADIGFVLGTVGLAAGAGSTALTRVIAAWGEPTVCDEYAACTGPDAVLRNVVVTLLVLGVLGKSAQIPFQDWLPDAMEGPTPASALIHAATMVAAGTVVLAGLFPVLAQAQVARWVLGVSTALTMLVAALLAMGQSDLKRLLAWSTVSQVAIMLSALASAGPADGPDAGLFHLWSHAIFKSLLFLAIGLLGVIAGGTTAVLLRGIGMRSRLGRWAFLIGLLSLAGVPFLVGGLQHPRLPRHRRAHRRRPACRGGGRAACGAPRAPGRAPRPARARQCQRRPPRARGALARRRPGARARALRPARPLLDVDGHHRPAHRRRCRAGVRARACRGPGRAVRRSPSGAVGQRVRCRHGIPVSRPAGRAVGARRRLPRHRGHRRLRPRRGGGGTAGRACGRAPPPP
jgi:NADH-quinone oxidoreductase subunit L